MNYIEMNDICEFLHDNPLVDMKKLLQQSKTGFVGFVVNNEENVKAFKKKFSEDKLIEYIGVIAPKSLTFSREIFDQLDSTNQLLLTIQFDVTVEN